MRGLPMREIDRRPVVGLLALLKLLLLCSTVASAQNASDVISIFRGLAQTAIVQSTLFEWQKLPKDELACINTALVSRGDSVQALIQRGVKPTERRISDLRASCVSQFARRSPNADGQSIYVVDGLQLGERVQQDSSTYRQYRCAPSEQFSGLTWCQKRTDERTARGQFSSSYSILHSEGGVAVYVNRRLEPAWFSGTEANDDISSRSKKYGAPTRVIPMPPQSSVPNGTIVTWGKVILEPLDPNDIGQLAMGRDVHVGFMIDHIGNFQRSAQQGLPIYRIIGGAGYVWAASWDQRGVGTLRFLTVDASAIAQLSNGGAEVDAGAVSDREQFRKTPPISTNQDSSEKVGADALATENARLLEEQGAAVEESNRKRIADAESLKQALDDSRRAAEEARAEALQAKQAAEQASENARLQSKFYLTISGVVIIVLIITLACLAFTKWRSGTVGRAQSGQEACSVLSPTNAEGLPKSVTRAAGVPELDSLTHAPPAHSKNEREPISRRLPESEPIQSPSSAKISSAVSILSGGLNAVLVFMTIGGGLLSLVAYIFMNASGPNLKVWTEQVYLDPKATSPVLILNIQSKDETPVVLTGVSVNDDSRCFQNHKTTGNKDLDGLNDFNMIIMNLAYVSKGISIMKDGYSKQLRLGEIERLGLGAPQFGGCVPVKVVITTDRGSSTFNFE